MKKWKIRDRVYSFPIEWDKNKVMRWCNYNIRVCEYCGKVDATIDHYDDCSPMRESQRQTSCYGI